MNMVPFLYFKLMTNQSVKKNYTTVKKQFFPLGQN